ncbi:helix-turn-helix domain-containing protein [Phytoactinopolyspora limicola]|uniref:helix-turn-helix domain-containing protein n=1 Tax=Phytoactinopolyspora limicola TaxID=2715536 RepID=UPI001408C166|nr:helix-turn-helix domain-containing protein [Phytoactinopolyspora limicola]
MVKMRHSAIPEVPYAPPSGVTTGVEVLTLAQLRQRASEDGLPGPQRPGFHLLFAIEHGALWHSVDFTGHVLRPGSWLWVRPGQVQQFGDLATADGQLVLFQSSFLDPATAAAARLDEAFGPAYHRPAGSDAVVTRGIIAQLRHTFDSRPAPPQPVHTAILRHLLSALVLRLSHLAGPTGGAAVEPDATFRRFRAAVEQNFFRFRQVAYYARALGYSTRTLTRSTQAAAGVSAKEFIDRRVILEARRLLAHADLPAARIAAQLGFDDATNFSKYFHHRTGATPGAFRASVRASSR